MAEESFITRHGSLGRCWKLGFERSEEKRRKIEMDYVGGPQLALTEFKEEKKEFLLCIFFKFRSGPVLYSLYAYVVAESDVINNKSDFTPSPPLTMLEMPRHEKFPIGMACAKLDSRVYFVGGQCKFENAYYASKKVYFFDIDKFRDRIRGPSATNTSSSGGLVNCDELSECPNMHGGKCNPTVVVANGKLYVISGLICGDVNNKTLGSPPHLNLGDWSFIYAQDHEWERCVFEVYDPVTQEWTILPQPAPFSYPVCILPEYCNGHAVIHEKIFFCYQRRKLYD